MNILRVGLIGAGGSISKLRAAALLASPRAQVVAVSDVDETRWPGIREQYGLDPVKDCEQMVQSTELDAVIASTPNTCHYEDLRVALNHGKHAACEYPLVQTLEQYDTLVHLAREKGVVLHNGLTPVIEDYQLAFKEHLPKVGRPLTMTYTFYVGKSKWYYQEQVAGNPFVMLHIHQITQAMDLFGEVESVYAGTLCMDIEGGQAKALPAFIKFRSGVTAIYNLGVGVAAAPEYRLTLIGDEGMLDYRTDYQPPKFLCKVGNLPAEEKDLPMRFDAWIQQDTEAFLDEVFDGQEPPMTLSRGREILRITLLLDESSRCGQVVTA